MKTSINYKKAVVAGILVIIINMVIGNLLYMNPIVAGAYKAYEGHPSIQPMEAFGGVAQWVLLTLAFGLGLTIFFMSLYLTLYNALPGTGWKKGLFYGGMLACIKAVPEAFNQWTLFVYPETLILIQLLNTCIGLVLFGIYLSVLFEKFHVIASTTQESHYDKNLITTPAR